MAQNSSAVKEETPAGKKRALITDLIAHATWRSWISSAMLQFYFWGLLYAGITYWQFHNFLGVIFIFWVVLTVIPCLDVFLAILNRESPGWPWFAVAGLDGWHYWRYYLQGKDLVVMAEHFYGACVAGALLMAGILTYVGTGWELHRYLGKVKKARERSRQSGQPVRMPSTPRQNELRSSYVITVLVSLGGIGYGSYGLYMDHRFSTEGVTAGAKVLENTYYDIHQHSLRLSFNDAQNRPVEVQTKLPWQDAQKIKDTVDVRYLPSDPRRFQVAGSEGDDLAFHWFSLGFGLFFAFLVWLGLSPAPQKPPPGAKK